VGFDRILATQFGVAAVKAVADGAFSKMVAYRNDKIERVPLASGAGKNRFVDPHSQYLQAARQRGIGFGD
jgi:6-phosphofructokinase 1